MNFIELVLFVFENIRRQRGRVILTSMGVAIGSAAIILLVALVNGLQQNTTSQFTSNQSLTQITVNSGFGRFVAVSQGGRTAVRTNSSTSTELAITDSVVQQLAALDHVSLVVPEETVSGGTLAYQKFEARSSITGVDLTDLSKLGLTASEGSLQLAKGEAVIGYSVPSSFYRVNYSGPNASLTKDLLNETLKMTLSRQSSGRTAITKTVSFKVVGIMKETSNQSDYSIYITMADADAITNWQNNTHIDHSTSGYNSVTIQVNDTQQVTAVADKITNMGFQANTAQSFLQNVNSLFTILQLVFGGVGAITLLVAAFGIANTMTMAILERTREIGLLKALGATNQNILSLFLGEAAGIGLLGGVGGTAFGLVLGNIVNVVAVPYLQAQAASSGGTAPTTAVLIPFYLPVFCLVFSTLIGTLSGLYPSLRAASMLPVIALKNE